MGKLYVAYGSNLNVKQMARRCPTAKLVGTGIINDYELQFKGREYGAYATIEQKNGSAVPVAIWDIQKSDEAKLDKYEGYPNSYFKENICVTFKGEEISAMVYIMDLKQSFGIPTDAYYDTVAQGYMDCSFDIDVLDKAVNESMEKYYENAFEIVTDEPLFCDENNGEAWEVKF